MDNRYGLIWRYKINEQRVVSQTITEGGVSFGSIIANYFFAYYMSNLNDPGFKLLNSNEQVIAFSKKFTEAMVEAGYIVHAQEVNNGLMFIDYIGFLAYVYYRDEVNNLKNNNRNCERAFIYDEKSVLSYLNTIFVNLYEINQEKLDNIINSINEILKKYKNFSKLHYYIDEDKNGCFALFIKQNGNKYIAFSGFFDIINDKSLIYKSLGLSDDEIKTRVETAYLMEQMAFDLNCTFVSTTVNVATYTLEKYTNNIIIDKKIGDHINRNTFKKNKQDYACCERKIFAEFYNCLPSGILYVKKALCGRCLMGLAYQLKNKSLNLKWIEGIY